MCRVCVQDAWVSQWPVICPGHILHHDSRHRVGEVGLQVVLLIVLPAITAKMIFICACIHEGNMCFET